MVLVRFLEKKESDDSFNKRKLDAVLNKMGYSTKKSFRSKQEFEDFFKDVIKEADNLDRESDIMIILMIVGFSAFFLQGKKVSKLILKVSQGIVHFEHRGPFRGTYKADVPIEYFQVLYNKSLIKRKERHTTYYDPGYMFVRVDDKPLYGNEYEIIEKADLFDENKMRYLMFVTENFERFGRFRY